ASRARENGRTGDRPSLIRNGRSRAGAAPRLGAGAAGSRETAGGPPGRLLPGSIATRSTPPSHPTSPMQHRLLALDGGGIRGIITLEVLAEIENQLRQRYRRDDFVLADYFDYVAGTSTGAIIATCVALGMPVAEIRRFYIENGEAMFDKAGLLRRFRYKFE